MLIAADRNFGELIFHQELAHAGVMFFRLPGATLHTKMAHLNTVLEEHADELERGKFLVITAGQMRVAGRPRALCVSMGSPPTSVFRLRPLCLRQPPSLCITIA